MWHFWPSGNTSEPRGSCQDLEDQTKQGDLGDGKEFRLDCDYDWTGEMLKHLLFNVPNSGYSEANWNPKS